MTTKRRDHRLAACLWKLALDSEIERTKDCRNLFQGIQLVVDEINFIS